ncbi:hypothetical protein NM688_g8190 [Phlebia brevispora]|uniref:Uncharacterized protein n=1 Tax=Phlebia brevispora TaxID=194682 RepID=A0ACC1RW39_9APHY|nr:hypothetical protein NM688_g8190 [Phlebia brevispora]
MAQLTIPANIFAVTFRYRATLISHVPNSVKSLFPRLTNYAPLSTFEAQAGAGLTSESFDVEANIRDGDSRAGLDERGTQEVLDIMRREGVNFDQARLIRQNRIFAANGIGPNVDVQLDRTQAPISSKSCFPTEIIDKIAAFVVGSGRKFSDIANFSLVCYRFRQLAFRHYFVILRAEKKSQWYRKSHIPGVSLWVRKIECNSSALYVCTTALQQFINLRTAVISFHTEGRNTQYTGARLILKNIPPTVTRLNLEYLPLVNPDLLRLICDALPDLRFLHVSCSERLLAGLECCWDCYDDCGSGTLHSPIPRYYCNVYNFTASIGPSLAPLKKLEELVLGVYLSDEKIFYDHIDHSEDPDAPFPFGPDECSLCAELHTDVVRETEMLASAEIAQYFPNLKTVSWSSFFTGNQPGDDPANQRTTMWIKRERDTLAVKRAQWVLDKV